MTDQREQLKQNVQNYSHMLKQFSDDHGSEQRHWHMLKQFSADYHSDEKLRARIDGGDVAPLFEATDLPGDAPSLEGVKVRVVADTNQVQHVVIPPDPARILRDSEMQGISGGSTAGTAGTGGSASSVICSTAPSCLSSVGSASTVGSAS